MRSLPAEPEAPGSLTGAGPVDLLIVGGGVNGCGIAREAAGRGYSVILCERGDLAEGTSSASTKLVHGGLRYLEHYEFRLVREALREREVLLSIAPHIVQPQRFLLPYEPGLRPAWLLRLGLLIYDNCYRGRTLPGTRTIDLRNDAAGTPLQPRFTTAFEYSDCTVDDARLVVLNATDAAARGARIATRTRVESARRTGGLWDVTVQDVRTGARSSIAARALVNAAGPFVVELLAKRAGVSPPATIRLVRGSHIVVPQLFDHGRAYFFQNADGRLVFAIPYLGRFTLIGTTDRDQLSVDDPIVPDAEEIRYLCAAANQYFRSAIGPEDVVWRFAGVRPLRDDGAGPAQEATRDYELFLDEAEGAPLLSVYGGKITTYRKLALAAIRKLAPTLGRENGLLVDWTGSIPLPGGDLGPGGLSGLMATLTRDYPGLERETLERLARAYGTCARKLLGDAETPADLGQSFGAGLSAVEVAYLMEYEWAQTAADIVWRRSKLGLLMSAEEIARLDRFMAGRSKPAPAAPEMALSGRR